MNRNLSFEKAKNAFVLLVTLVSITKVTTRKVEILNSFALEKTSVKLEYKGDFGLKKNPEFEIKLGKEIDLQKANIYVILESTNLNFYLNVWKNPKRNISDAIKAGTYSGNILFMVGSGLQGKRLKRVKKSRELHFAILCTNENIDWRDTSYKLTVIADRDPTLHFGKVYTTRMDPSIKTMSIKWVYNGMDRLKITKLRFQATAIRVEKDWRLSSSLKHGGEEYTLNSVFKHTIGGVLTYPFFSPCQEIHCEYFMNMSLENVTSINVETYIVQTMEEVSIQHYESYYDRAYAEDSVIMYKLPYSKEMDKLDLTFTVIPVTGSTQLYLNVQTIPTSEDTYDFKVIGQLAKKYTLAWDELVKMKAVHSAIFIAVRCPIPGEFLLKIDAHEKGYRGSLTPGIIEAGSVKFKEIVNYMYMFEVSKTQEVQLELSLEVTTGNLDLFLLQCEDYNTCMIEADDIEGKRRGLIKKRDGLSQKKIVQSFTCEHRKHEETSLCQFAVGVLGKEDGSSHFEISLNEEKTHRLMIPGHSVSVNLLPLTKNYFKFSFPRTNTDTSRLFLNVESIWGEFQVFISKQTEYPDSSNFEIHEIFESPKNALYQSMRVIEILPAKMSDNQLEGVYYLAIEALQETSLHLKFFEKGNNQISVHTLAAGKQVRGEITNLYETMYYTIPVSLVPGQASSIEVYLTPLKGHFIMMANTNGVLPNFKKNQYYTENNHLEFFATDSRKEQSEYLIGVALHEFPEQEEAPKNDPFAPEEPPEDDLSDSFQFFISFSYTNKPIKLSPGVIITSMISRSNLYLIEVLDDFSDLLVLKSNLDGYTMTLCGHFSTADDSKIDSKTDLCKFSTSDKSVALYLKQNDIKSECQRVRALSENHSPKCFFIVEIKGRTKQVFRIGYTYNERPFQLIKGEILNGPHISDANGRINFVYHAEKNKELGLYFNSKGRNLRAYTKLIRSDDFKDSMVIDFPTKNNFDSDASSQEGYVQRIYYSKELVSQFGDQPELLISVRPDENASSFDNQIFDGSGYFVIQTSMDTLEISRTQTITQNVQAKEYNFFSFYNNGNEESIRIYVMSNNSAALTVMLAPGNKSRPPISCKPVASQSGVGSVELIVTAADLRASPHQSDTGLRGHYMLTVESSISTELTLYWNNKSDLDYIELTPNEPNTMLLKPNKKFYFTFYARDIEGGASESSITLRKDIRIYVKTDVRTNVYVTRSTTGELEIPDLKNSLWKTSFGDSGGVKSIEITPKDKHYCVDCLYIGYIENDAAGQVTVIANIKHSGTAVELKPGLTFPEYLSPGEDTLLRVYNPDDQQINLTVSMTTGFVNVYIGRTIDVSQKNYLEMHSLETGLSIHRDIPIIPKKYKIEGPSEFFVLLVNRKAQEAGCTVTVYKNHQRSPLEPGVTKFLHLSQDEKVEFFYQPKADEPLFEIRLEVTQVMNLAKTEDTLRLMDEAVSVYELGLSGAHLPLDRNEFYEQGNSFYYKFDIGKGNTKVFGIRIANPVETSLGIQVDLLNGNYKLVNLNSPIFGAVGHESSQVYEAFGVKGKYLFVELKKCVGDPKLSFFESDFSQVEIDQNVKTKKIEDENSSVQYLRLKSKNLFFRVESADAKYTSYVVNVFNEDEMNMNPYFEIGNDDIGRVSVQTENRRVVFDSVSLDKFFEKEFRHKITYKLYLSPSPEVVRYAKNCDRQLIRRAFPGSDLVMFSDVHHLVTEEAPSRGDPRKSRVYSKSERLSISFSDLRKNIKYYGVVVAVVELFPLDQSFLTPVRSTRVYYDEFSLINARFEFPLLILVSSIVIIGLLYILFSVIRAYIFGKIVHLEKWDDSVPEALATIEQESAVGLKGFTMLERAYYFEQSKSLQKSAQKPPSQAPPKEDDDDLKLADSSSSLEEHCQEIELEEQDKAGKEANI